MNGVGSRSSSSTTSRPRSDGKVRSSMLDGGAKGLKGKYGIRASFPGASQPANI